MPGPAAVVMALVMSGIDSTRFVFEGFLPRSGGERTERLAEVAAERRTTVMYEAPHRIVRTVHDLHRTCGPDRRIAIARELTKLHEELWHGTLDDAVAHVSETEPRGEYVVVLAGAAPAAAADDEAIRAAILAELGSGATRKDAVATVTARLGAAKRRVYEIATALHDMNRQLVNNRWLLKGLFSRVPYKRDMYIWFTLVSAKMALGAIKEKVSPLNVSHYQQLEKPWWYDS